MEKLTIAPTLNTPGVTLDPVGNKFELKGESRPENVRSFYLPILEWLEKFATEIPGRTEVPHLNSVSILSTSTQLLPSIFWIFLKS